MTRSPYFPFGPVPLTTAKARVFIGYHHKRDQGYHDRFVLLFAGLYDIVTDRSLDQAIESDDPEYVKRRIREVFITGSSTTVVLCGLETWKRKHVDWEIHATLDKNHALLGMLLPTHCADIDGRYLVPDRLHDNIESGYAHWVRWSESPDAVRDAFAQARDRAASTQRIRNDRPQMERNLS
jgi:hypothetical protein